MMNFLKLILFLIFSSKFSQCQDSDCKYTVKYSLNWSCFKDLAKNFGSINFVLSYKFLQGSEANFSELSHLWMLQNKKIIFEPPILLIEPYKVIKRFDVRFYSKFSYEAILFRNMPTPIKLDDKFLHDKHCASDVESIAWQVSDAKKFCIVFYACHVSFTKSDYITTKRIIIMLENSMEINEINHFNLSKSEYEGKFFEFDKTKGENFCMCNFINESFNENFENQNATDDELVSERLIGIIIIFIVSFGILALIYESVVKERKLFKNSRKVNVATQMN